MFVEVRQYGAKPGMRDDLVRVREQDVIPCQVSKGMLIVGSFVALDDENVCVWIRRFKSDEDKDRLYVAVDERDEWEQVIAPKVGAALDRQNIRISRVAPAAASVLH